MSGEWILAGRDSAELARLSTGIGESAELTRLRAILAAYVRQSVRPDVHPDYRWRAVLPDGTVRFFGSESEAMAAITGERGRA